MDVSKPTLFIIPLHLNETSHLDQKPSLHFLLINKHKRIKVTSSSPIFLAFCFYNERQLINSNNVSSVPSPENLVGYIAVYNSIRSHLRGEIITLGRVDWT